MNRFATLCLAGIFVFLLIANLSAQWEPDVRLTVNDSVSTTGYNNALNITSGPSDDVHVVWMDSRNSSPYFEIYYKRSTDGGVVWSTDTRLTYEPAWSACPGIAIAVTKVHVVWMDSRDGAMGIYYKYSPDQGINWSSDIRLTDLLPDSSQTFPSIAVTGDVVHVVWGDVRAGNYEIFYKRSADGGSSWSADTRLTSAPDSSTHASVSVSGSLVSVVWYDFRDGNPEIYYKRSTDGGINWSTDTRLTNDTHHSYCPLVSTSDTNVHVVWHDDRNGFSEIYYKRSTNGGSGWSADIRLTYVPSNESSLPSIVTSGDNIHLVWNDTRDGNHEIYYKRSTDGGVVWSTDTRLTNAPDSSACASVSFAATKVHVVWTDKRDGNFEIYYKRDSTGNTGVKERENPQLENRNLKLIVYPNPFTTFSSIYLSSIVHRAEGIELKIYDVSGRLVKDFSLLPFNFLLSTTVEWDG
ncbi:exo-alpha-sialidase, partial [candidate division WOR-3 bacterium]|nr:exo-alpha-sialidase [candidate division WOR-3 bacterium]